MSRQAWLAVVAILAIGCGHPAPPTSPTPPKTPPADAAVATGALEDDPPRLADRALKLFTEWKSALETSSDCATAAEKMNAIADANKDLIEANARLLRATRDKVLAVRAELEKRDAEMEPIAKAISAHALMMKCSDQKAFSKAVDRLAGE